MKLRIIAGALALVSCLAVSGQSHMMEVNTKKMGAPVQSTMYGLFFEDINYAADGGLYGELVKNRSFEFPDHLMGWEAFGKFEVEDDGPFERCPHYVQLRDPGHKERRLVPYVISILSYFFCIYLMDLLHIPHFMGTILSAALFIQIVCALINVWWKISTHTAAIGGVAGALFVFGEFFGFNPVWWLCVVFFLAGLLGTSRMILRQHSLLQVVAGFVVGLVCSAIGLVYL